MALQFDCAVFDLDGTVLDTSEGILAAVKYTIDRFGLAPLSDETIKTFIGPPIQDSFERIYDIHGERLAELADSFRNRYKNEDLLKAKPYEGIFDVFAQLCANGIKPAVATYKRQDYALSILKHFGFDIYTDLLFGADFDGRLKKKDIIENALNAASVSDRRTAVMIGDSDNDAVGAELAGTAFVGVTYGFGFRTKADVFRFRAIGAADDTAELKKIILEAEK